MRLFVDARPIIDPAQGGVSRVAHAIVSAYAETFPQDELICVTTGSRRPTLPADLTTRPNIRHEHLTIPNKLWDLVCFLSLGSLIRVIQKRIGKIDAAFLPNLGFVGTLPADVPTTLLLHDLSFLIEPRWFSPKQRLWHFAVRAKQLIRSATALLSVSETTKQDAIHLLGIPKERIRVILMGQTLHPAEPPHPSNLPLVRGEHSRFLLAMGQGDKRKNVRTILEAVNILREEPEFKDIELIVTGPTNRPSDEELQSLYANASAFLYPSWYEGYGLPLHEAATFGTPCIASSTGALPETAPTGTVFANPAKPHEWMEAIRMIVQEKEAHRTASQMSPAAWKETAQVIREALTKLKK